ncbi:hypothetical protein K7432_000012 [Basidiobolus ranarum]|uniref:Uncharacterized protein n=1 Tax=Basidiobolus ranarum TaxID=34480 RepID=A0ABR2WBV8_9FUNG
MLGFTLGRTLKRGIRLQRYKPLGQFASIGFVRYTHINTSYNNDLVTIESIPEQNTAIIHLHRAPANAFNDEMVRTVTDVFTQIEKDKSVRTVIFASKIPKFFSAGVDLEDFHRSGELWMEFWRDLRTMFITIHGSRLNTIAAVNGFAVGLGCALTLACQDRYMLSGKGAIGINPVNIGIPVPVWLVQRYVEVLGYRTSEKMLTAGVSLKATEAKKIGLVDEIFDDHDQLLEACKKLAREKHKINETAQVETARLLKVPFIKTFYSEEAEDMERMAGFIERPEMRQIIKGMQAQIEAKKIKS